MDTSTKIVRIGVVIFCCHILLANVYALTKEEFLATKVPVEHDFNKINPQMTYRPQHLIVRLAPQARGFDGKVKCQNIVSAAGGGKVKKRVSQLNETYVIELPDGVKIEDALKTYNARDDILYAEPDYGLELANTTPNDIRFEDLWGLHNTGQTGGTADADIDAPEAWDIRTDANDIIVAVIDTGVDYTHPDLAANMWVNQAEFLGDPNYDDDNNGYKDDIRGWDFFAEDNDPMDYYSHGTHCAGTIGAIGNNGIGVAGVCWKVKIMPLQVSHYDEEGWEIWASNASEAIYYAVNNGAKILSNSWGGYSDIQVLRDAVEYCLSKKVLFIAAAGNEELNFPRYPARYDYDNIIAVLATNHNDEMADFSSYGAATVDIGAPGVDILSTLPYNNYDYYNGTSMAAPHVSGVCALVWSLYPRLSAVAVKQAILDGADRLDALDGLCVTGGRLNAYGALMAACPLTLTIEDDISTCTNPGDTITYTFTCTNRTTTNSADPNFYYGPVDDITVTTNLPAGVTCSPSNPNYDPQTHTYIWTIDSLAPGESDSTTLTVTVNNGAEPGLPMEARSVLDVAGSIYRIIESTIPVCCWGGDVIYVNTAATGLNTGVGWANAYTTLQKTIARVNRGCSGQIWVAEDTYKPGTQATDSFIIPAGISVYGGFAGNEMSILERNIPANLTILSGCINETIRSEAVVVMDANALLDGFTVEGGKNGILSEDNITVRNCRIRGNTWDGIHHEGAGKTASVFNCWITGNQQNGCCFIDSAAILKNNIFNSNSSDSGGEYYSLCFSNSLTAPVVYNNTFVNNFSYAVGTIDPNSNNPQYPDIQNCIVWYNNNDDEQLYGYEHTQYSCVYDPNNNPNDPNGMDYTFDAYGNFSGLPGFICDYVNDPNADPNLLNVHLAYDSFCRDGGDPNLSYEGQVDIDNQSRVLCGRADIGADEYVAVLNITTNTAYDTIQDAIDEASNGDEIVVYPGTYEECVDLSYKAVILRSADPNDWDIVNATIIHADTGPTVAIWHPSQSGYATLKGFTVTNTGEEIAAIRIFDGFAVVSHCVVRSSYDGIGCDGSWPLITNCIIENSFEGIYCTWASATIANCIIRNNDCGIFLFRDLGSVVKNCTIVSNTGDGIYSFFSVAPTVINSILWNSGDDLYNCSATYSCIKDNDGGTGNIHSNPSLESNCRLISNSPCIDVGDNSAVSQGDTDIDNEPRIIDDGYGTVDMGADEFNPD
jgi:parallel beta-helix repeat protein